MIAPGPATCSWRQFGHFGDNRSRESNGLRHGGNRLEVSQTPDPVAVAKAPVECLVARGPDARRQLHRRVSLRRPLPDSGKEWVRRSFFTLPFHYRDAGPDLIVRYVQAKLVS
jgi:hypothetical protein